MDFGLAGKLVLVTGSSQGIGRATAEAFLDEGARVVVNGRDEEKLERVRAELGERGEVHAVAADVADGDQVERLVGRVRELGPLDVLVANAAIFEVVPFEEIGDEEWRRYFDVNVLGAVRLARAFLPGMLERGWGRVVLVASEAGVKPLAEMIHYSTTKTALLGLARGLAERTKGTGVTVNSLLPGPTLTEGVESFLAGAAREMGVSRDELVDGYFEENEPSSLLQRWERPEEVARVAVFLASDAAAVVNGSAQRAEGGIIRSIL